MYFVAAWNYFRSARTRHTSTKASDHFKTNVPHTHTHSLGWRTHDAPKRERKRNSTNENDPLGFSGTNAWINYRPQSMPKDNNNKIIVTFQLQTLYARTWSSNSSWPFHAASTIRFENVFRLRKTTPKAIPLRIDNEKSHLWIFRHKKRCQRRHDSWKILEKNHRISTFYPIEYCGEFWESNQHRMSANGMVICSREYDASWIPGIHHSTGYFQYRLTIWPQHILYSSKFSASSWVENGCFIVDRIDGKGKSVKISPSRVCALNA